MNYRELMSVLSQCELGAALLSEDGAILELNETGLRLLHGDGSLAGKYLRDIAPNLCSSQDPPLYENIAFGEYLLRCPTPDVCELPADTSLLVFRNAVNDACHDMLISILNRLDESVALFDAKGRFYFLNDASVKLESLLLQDVAGADVSTIYRMCDDGGELVIPRVLAEKRPILNHRQHYITCYGKEIATHANTYPVIQNGQVLGGFNVMEDWNQIDDLYRQIFEPQEQLASVTSSGKPKKKHVLSAKYQFKDIICKSSAMERIVQQGKQIAKSDSSVMIYGETGTGKELLAQSIHNASRRSNGPFLAINCAAIPENLLEGLLFGTEKGAYTGAESRPGLFEQADSGTLLLDEINSMPIHLQSKLLRVLQEGTLRRVGGATELRVDVRVLSNINIPPYQAIQENKLRRDLFYRLGVVNLNIPPLRDRKEDIALLAKNFIFKYNKKLEKNVNDIDGATLERFLAYDWPGNVRELQHAIEHAMNLLPEDRCTITPDYIPDHILTESLFARQEPAQEEKGNPSQSPGPRDSLNQTIHEVEYSNICKALRENGGNISRAAKQLQISRQNLQYRIKRYKIDLDALLQDQRFGG